MSLIKAGTLALLIPLSAAAPAFAQATDAQGPTRMIFSELDTDGNGAVTLEELQAVGSNRFSDADTDGSGALSRAELLAQSQERAETRVDRLLERADADGNGELTAEELETAREEGRRGGRGHGRGHGARGEHRGPGVERFFERMDADNNGSVSEAEFNEAIANMVERMGRRHGGRGN
ncbi:EF-hand domain-containing protein [Gymnodinialimonas ceratoperidinii]|uniref:EF-hand domain-containing protein n=1 Tax=Gymnodinialimonas ceratoperidinii TaxID=2856823 RepID=A0A8F6TYE0_9RHOB|nr:EF-hand domain-containing protein [Gymnodinialimonas ceratoperidinii]QXT40955.1 EF-hand domain-containing protein [Gymnodinialimonas ceratoperidinii]